MNLLPFVTTWVVLALIIVALAVWRTVLARHEEPTTSLHVAAGSIALPDEAKTEKQLGIVDRWGQILTIVGVLYGLVLAGIYLYQQWFQSVQIEK